MTPAPIPVLWLCGPPGVGKTSVAWDVRTRIDDAAYVDIDQLGICPEPAADPGRHRTKARNLAAVVDTFRTAGAACVVVSGVADAATGPPPIPGAALTAHRLRADRDELARRVVGRGGDAEEVTAALAEADALDAGATADRVIDTGGRSVAEVADLVLAGGWPASGPSRSGPPSPATAPEGAPVDGPVVWVAGPTAVGKSTVGFALHLRLHREGLPAAYVDVDQLGFGGDGGHGVKSRNLAAVRRTFHAVGARVLVVTGGLEDDAALATYTAAVPAATSTVLRLRAGRDELVRRALRRGAGHGWRQPGDPLLGRSADALRAIADAAARSGAALTGGLDVDTDGRTADQVTDAVLGTVLSMIRRPLTP